MARVGILGGTFNPPHLGHLALARHARAELALARVLLMPAHTPPHKLPSARTMLLTVPTSPAIRTKATL